MLRDLRKSGLGPREARALGLEYSIQEGFECYAIPYLSLAGKPTDHVRVRYLGDPDKLPKDQRGMPMRYSQPPGHAPRFYYARLGNIRWSKVASDPGVVLYFTEGEKKA